MIIKMNTPKYGERSVLIDDDDYGLVSKYTWTLWSTKRHTSIYVVTTRSKTNGPQQRLHRLIMNAKPGQLVDHINGNALDNRKENLRVTNSAGNNKNAKKRRNARTSSYKGVHKSNRPEYTKKPWIAQIQVNGKKKNLGYYTTELEAAEAYNKAATETFGEFAVLNNVQYNAH